MPEHISAVSAERTEWIQIADDGTFIQLEPIKDSPAMLVPGPSETTSRVIAARRRGETTPSAMNAAAEFMLAVAYALRHLPHVRDLRARTLDDHAIELSSHALGIACRLDSQSGECQNIILVDPEGQQTVLRTIEHFPEPLFPARPPSLVRIAKNVNGDKSVAHILVYDKPAEALLSNDAIYDWKTYSEEAHDASSGVILTRDGTRNATHNPHAAVMESFLNQNPSIFEDIKGKDNSEQPPADAHAINSPQHTRGRSTWSLPAVVLVLIGCSSVGIAAVLAWHRRAL